MFFSMLAMYLFASVYWSLSLLTLFNRISFFGVAVSGQNGFPINAKSEAFPMMGAIILLNVSLTRSLF